MASWSQPATNWFIVYAGHYHLSVPDQLFDIKLLITRRYGLKIKVTQDEIKLLYFVLKHVCSPKLTNLFNNWHLIDIKYNISVLTEKWTQIEDKVNIWYQIKINLIIFISSGSNTFGFSRKITRVRRRFCSFCQCKKSLVDGGKTRQC